jgi:hypothetical protein
MIGGRARPTHGNPVGPLRPAPDLALPCADLVEQMAEAMAANPVYRITDKEAAMAYFRGVPRNRLAAASQGPP